MNAKVVWSWRSAVLSIVVLFLVTRLYHLTLLPLSGGEATPITWALQAQQLRDWSDWFAAVRAAAQPLHSWLLVPVISLASNCADQACHPDRVLAARLLSVASGAVTLTLVFALTTRLFGRAAACAAALVYVCTPLTLLHDRLALPAALLTAASVLVLWCLLSWCEQPDVTGRSRTSLWKSVVRLRPVPWRSGVLGIVLGLALLTSSEALALLFVIPGAVALWRPRSLRRWWSLANACLVAGLLFSVVFTDSLAGSIAAPLSAPAAAAAVAADWATSVGYLAAAAWTYLTWPFVVLLGGAALWAGVMGQQRGLTTEHSERSTAEQHVAGTRNGPTWRGVGVCLLWSIGSAVGVLSSQPAPTTADLVFVMVPTFPLVGWGLARLTAASQRLPELVSALVKLTQVPAGGPVRSLGAGSQSRTTRGPKLRRSQAPPTCPVWPEFWPATLGPIRAALAAGIVLGVYVAPAVAWGWSLLADPTSTAWHDGPGASDRDRYIEGRQSGYGLREIVDRLRAAAEHQQVVVFTADAAGMPRDGVRVLLGNMPSPVLATVPPGMPVAEWLAQRVGREYQAASTGAALFYLLDDDHSGAGDRAFRRVNPGARVVQRVMKPGSHRFVLYKLPWQPPGDDHWLDPPPRFGERIALAGYALSATTYRAGDTVRFTLFWEALATPVSSYTVFTHIVADDPAQKIGQWDQYPVAGNHPTPTWRRGDFFTDPYEVPIDPNARPGSYRVIVGLYRLETLERLPVTVGDAGGTESGTDFYELAEIVVTAP